MEYLSFILRDISVNGLLTEMGACHFGNNTQAEALWETSIIQTRKNVFYWQVSSILSDWLSAYCLPAWMKIFLGIRLWNWSLLQLCRCLWCSKLSFVNGEDTVLNHSIFTLNNSSRMVKFVSYPYVLWKKKGYVSFPKEYYYFAFAVVHVSQTY